MLQSDLAGEGVDQEEWRYDLIFLEGDHHVEIFRRQGLMNFALKQGSRPTFTEVNGLGLDASLVRLTR
jgi:hypothetical protein